MWFDARVKRLRIAVRVIGLLFVLALLLVVAAGVLSVGVPDRGMGSSLNEDDRVLLVPFAGPDDLERLDLVATRFGPGTTVVVRRVVAIGGDRIRIVPDPAGPRVEVQPGGTGDWSRVVNPAWSVDAADPAFGQACCGPDGRAAAAPAEVLVPAGALYLMGDDYPGAADSRAQGFAPRSEVRGVVWLRVWPIGGFGSVGPDVSLAPVTSAGQGGQG